MASVFGFAASSARATTVLNCYDAGAGSLRDAIAATPNFGTVDMSGLTTSSPGCSASTISIHAGALVVGQGDELTIVGPGMSSLTVTACTEILRSRRTIGSWRSTG
jgi:hypothetical protein